MLKHRLIPVLFLKDGWMVRSEKFHLHQFIGNPVVHVERMVQWDVDELVILNISRLDRQQFTHDRLDYPDTGITNLLSFVQKVSTDCRIPLTFGGRLRTFKEIHNVILNGADKVILNKMLLSNTADVKQSIVCFGSQAIVASVDYRQAEGKAVAFEDDGRTAIERSLLDHCMACQDLGVGEIFLNSIDRDGSAQGYDVDVIAEISSRLSIPLIACGGAGHKSDFIKCFTDTDASAVAAGNIFHFTENAYPLAKNYLKQKNINVR